MQSSISHRLPGIFEISPGNSSRLSLVLMIQTPPIGPLKVQTSYFVWISTRSTESMNLRKIVDESEATKVLVDHHLNPTDFDDHRFWDDQASSTAEMINRLMDDMGNLSLINQDLATCLYTGIMTDTGSFRFNTTTPVVSSSGCQIAGNRDKRK